MRLSGTWSYLFAVVLLCGLLSPTSILCKRLEVTPYWGTTMFGENRKMTVDGRPWSVQDGYYLMGAESKLLFPWWDLFGFIGYRYAPRLEKLEGEPASWARFQSSSHAVSIGGGKHLKVGMARFGLKAGYVRLHDSFSVVQYEETDRESQVDESTGGNGVLLGADFLTPVFESISVSLSYNYVYRSSGQVVGRLPDPSVCSGEYWAISVGPGEHSYILGVAFRF